MQFSCFNTVEKKKKRKETIHKNNVRKEWGRKAGGGEPTNIYVSPVDKTVGNFDTKQPL